MIQSIQQDQAREILETLSFQDAASHSLQGLQHPSRIARLPVGSWQAQVMRESRHAHIVETPSELRAALADPDIAVIFLPHSAMITGDIITRSCIDCPLGKMVVWETNV